MSDDTKLLLKAALLNTLAITGYLSTAATFVPNIAFLRPYLRPAGVILIIIGVFRAAQSIISAKSAQIVNLTNETDAQIGRLKAECETQVAALAERITELSRKPYSEDLELTTNGVLNQMTHDGWVLLRHLLMNEPIEVGRPFIPEIGIEKQNQQMAIAFKGGLVRHDEKRQGAMVWTYFVVNPQFRPVVEKVLYARL